MWEYITLAISSALALIGACLNTQNDGEKKKTIFKSPNGAGWIVIILLLSSSIGQLVLQMTKESQEQVKNKIVETRRIQDSLNIQHLIGKSTEDSLYWLRQFHMMSASDSLLNTSYRKQIDVLTTSNNILSGTTSLLHPVLPMIAMFTMKVPFHDPWLKSYVKKIYHLKDSMEKNNLIGDIAGIDNISSNMKFGNSMKVYGFYVDRSSIFYINQHTSYSDPVKDGVAERFLNPGFSIVFFTQKPPTYWYNTTNDLSLEAEKIIDHPWPKSPFVENNFYLNFVDSFLIVNVYYKIDNFPNKASIIGVNDILNKYVLIDAHMPGKGYTILSLTFFTGQDFSNYTKIKFSKSDDISNSVINQYGGTSDTKMYVHRIEMEDLNKK